MCLQQWERVTRDSTHANWRQALLCVSIFWMVVTSCLLWLLVTIEQKKKARFEKWIPNDFIPFWWTTPVRDKRITWQLARFDRDILARILSIFIFWKKDINNKYFVKWKQENMAGIRMNVWITGDYRPPWITEVMKQFDFTAAVAALLFSFLFYSSTLVSLVYRSVCVCMCLCACVECVECVECI